MHLVNVLESRNQLDQLIKQVEKVISKNDQEKLYESTQSEPTNFTDAEKQKHITYLEELNNFLSLSKSIIRTQNEQRNRLYSEIHSKVNGSSSNYNDIFSRYHPEMNANQKEIFDLIRKLTAISLVDVNNKMSLWLEEHPIHELIPESSTSTIMLETNLLQLSIHLTEWFNTHENVFKDDESQSLIYLKDEKQQGIGFPNQLEPTIVRVVQELQEQLEPIEN